MAWLLQSNPGYGTIHILRTLRQDKEKTMTTGKVFDGKPYAGKWPILSAFACGVGLLCSCAVAEENAEGPIESPHARGGVVSIVETETCRRYVHVFTNTAEVAQFRNRSRQALRGRRMPHPAPGTKPESKRKVSSWWTVYQIPCARALPLWVAQGVLEV